MIRKLIRFYNKIKDRYQKTIIFISNDSDMLYNNTENIIYAKNNRIIESANTNSFYDMTASGCPVCRILC